MSVEVVARPLIDFDESSFRPSNDRFKDALVLPAETFDALYDGEHSGTGYVRARPAGSDEEWRGPFYALSFAPGHEPVSSASDEPPAAYVRLNLQREIGCRDGGSDPVVELTPVDAKESAALTVSRRSTREESTRSGTCFVTDRRTAQHGFNAGDTVEVSNPETGGRALLTLDTAPQLDDDSIALSTVARDLLGVDLARSADEAATTQVRVREPIGHDRSRSLVARAKTALLRPLVGFHSVRLRVVIGLNADENRNACRVDAETLDTLGIEDGDRVVVTSRSTTTPVRCHSLDADSYLVEKDDDIDREDISADTILLPSSTRDRCDAVVDDVVEVRRDMGYLTGKRVTLSLFGIVGVVISGTQTIDLLLPDLAPAVIVTVLTALSVLTVWLLLWPDRQRCAAT